MFFCVVVVVGSVAPKEASESLSTESFHIRDWSVICQCLEHVVGISLLQICDIINLYVINIYALTGVEVNQEQEFVVDTKGAGGQGRLEVTMVIVGCFFVFSWHHPEENLLTSCLHVCYYRS